MPRFAANLSFLFTELPLEQRFAAAAQAGFKGAEMLFPYDHRPERLGDLVAGAGLTQVLINAPAGDWQAGERGLAALDGRQREFRDGIDRALEYCELMDCTRLHVMAGLVPDEDDWPRALDVYANNLAYAADQCLDAEVTVVIEAINDRDMPDYFLRRPDDAVDMVLEVDRRNIKVSYDMYHAQIMQGGLSDFIEENLPLIAHMQVAGVPDRHEPDTASEVNWRYMFDLLDSHGYDGWVGCEYNPRLSTDTSFGWAKDWGIT